MAVTYIAWAAQKCRARTNPMPQMSVTMSRNDWFAVSGMGS